MKRYSAVLYDVFARFLARGVVLTGVARRVYSALHDLDPGTLDADSQQQIEALLSAWLAALRAHELPDDAKQLDWDETRAPVSLEQHGLMGAASLYIDHPYKLASPGAPHVYVSEPYQVEDAALEQLADLSRRGWHVRITGESLHYPGRCVQIRLRRE